jgi:4-amino-4-deoxy-L-arabinose transferase-like glycosyltransferase
VEVLVVFNGYPMRPARAHGVAGSVQRRFAKDGWAMIGALLIVALMLRVGFVLWTLDYPLVADSFDYHRHANAIVASAAYPESETAPGAGPTAFRPPGYPLFLAAVFALPGPDVTMARLAQALLGVVTVALIGFVSLRLWGSRVALVAVAMATVFPPLIFLGAALLSEPLFLPLELGALAAALQHRVSPRPGWLVAAGVLCGLAALTRTVGWVLVVPLALLVLSEPGLRRHKAPRAVALVAVSVLVVAPWTVRNAIVMDAFVPVSTQGGHTLAGAYNDTTRNQPFWDRIWVPSFKQPEFAGLYWRPEHQRDGLEPKSPAPGYAPPSWRTSVEEIELDKTLRSSARAFIAAHPEYPLELAAFHALTLFQLRGRDDARLSFEELAIPAPTARAWTLAAFYPFLLLALVGAFTTAARRTPRTVWLIPVVFLPVVLTDGLTRLRAPMDPFVVMLAALAVVALAERTARPDAS